MSEPRDIEGVADYLLELAESGDLRSLVLGIMDHQGDMESITALADDDDGVDIIMALAEAMGAEVESIH